MVEAPPPGAFKNLTAPTQAYVQEFLLSEKRGLWMMSHRRQGSTYATSVVANVLAARGHSLAYQDASALLDDMKHVWSLERTQAKRYDPLVQDGLDRMMWDIEDLWTIDVLWIDQLHSTLNIPMWRKHVQPRLERRVTQGKYTLVSTDMLPTHSAWADIQVVIEDLFVVARATR